MKRLITVLIGLSIGVAACSSTTPATPQVASLSSGGSAPASAAATTTQDRPRLKLNMTQQDWDVALAPYNKCLLAHGLTGDGGKIGLPQVRAGQQALVTEAQDACAALFPLPAWENDPKNPDALDFNRRVVACLHAKGVQQVEVDTVTDHGFQEFELAFGGPDNDPQSITLGLRYVQSCQQQASQK